MFPFNFTATPCFEFSSSPVNIPLGAEKGKKWRNENSITNTDVSVVRNFRLNFLDTTVYFFYLRRGYFVDNRTKWARWNERKTTEIYLCFFFLFFFGFFFLHAIFNWMRYDFFFFIFDRIFLSLFFFLSFFFRGVEEGGCYFFAVRYTSITWKRNILSISVSPGFRIIKSRSRQEINLGNSNKPVDRYLDR